MVPLGSYITITITIIIMNCKVVWPSRGAGVRDSWDSCKRFHGGAAELQAEVVDDGDGYGEDCDCGDSVKIAVWPITSSCR